MKYITIWDVAVARGVQEDEQGGVNSSEFERVKLHIIGGCAVCHATIAAHNAYPGRGGYWLCKSCIGDNGFETVEQFEHHLEEATKRRQAAAEEFQSRERK